MHVGPNKNINLSEKVYFLKGMSSYYTSPKTTVALSLYMYKMPQWPSDLVPGFKLNSKNLPGKYKKI